MRMWMLNPKILCDKHLRGEHGELHKFKPSFDRMYSITNRIHPIVQIEPANMKTRHDELVKEMIRRNMMHMSHYELPDLSYLPKHQLYAKADIVFNTKDLCDRCNDCKKRLLEFVEKRENKNGK